MVVNSDFSQYINNLANDRNSDCLSVYLINGVLSFSGNMILFLLFINALYQITVI